VANAKQTKLDAIKDQILKDKVCPELATTATQLVFGDGNPDSEIVFIGEAPGKNEDLQGLPFVGAAGKFLNEMLEMIDLKREDVYITNIVKYRPPDNRDPLPEEKKAFLPYLQSQLEVIQPKVVVTLGRHATSCFLPDLQISKIHGEPKRVKLSLKQHSDDVLEVVILPLFHPAAALYNPLQRQVIIDDFAKIPLIIKKIKS
jgi:uracil-DNA glycosylase